MRIHRKVLGVRQDRVLARLGPILTKRQFYMAGGTALALQLGHRRSVDFDWFTAEALQDPLGLAQDLRDEGIRLVTSQVEPGTLHGTVSGVRVSLLTYRYPLLQPLVPWPTVGCALASPADLAAMKLSAVAQRGAKKDFVDLYALSLRRSSLGQMLEWYRQKYSVADIAHVLYSLTYFDDADRERMPRMIWNVGWRRIKTAFGEWVKEATE